MTARTTHGERIAALEAASPFNTAAMETLMKRFDLMEQHVNERFDKIDSRLTAQEKKMEAYENKGKGLLLGVGLFGASLGAGLFAVVEKFSEFLK